MNGPAAPEQEETETVKDKTILDEYIRPAVEQDGALLLSTRIRIKSYRNLAGFLQRLSFIHHYAKGRY